MGVEFAQKCTKCNAEDQTARFWFERIEFSEWKWNARFLDNVEIELHLKFLLHPKTIYYLPVECNFQHLPVEKEKLAAFFNIKSSLVGRTNCDRKKATNCRRLLAANRTITICLKQVHLRKEGGGAFIVCHLHGKSSNWFYHFWDFSYELVLHPLSFCNDQCYLCLTREGPSRAVMRVMKGSHAKQELYIQLYCKRGWWYW